MMKSRGENVGKFFHTILKWLIGIICISPMYVAIIYSLKSKQELAVNRFALPEVLYWENFSQGIVQSNFFHALKNSFITTSLATIILTVICSMASYIIARKNNSKFYNAVYFIFVAAMIIPFQSILTPLYINLLRWGLVNSLIGFVLAKSGFQVAFTVLIITGFVKSIPRELEEAANIDGAGLYRTYWQIIFPLMKPVIFTSVVLNALNIWNDFQISVTILQKQSVRTLPLTQYFFFGENNSELGLAFAVFVLSMTPVLTLYLSLQKYIISGITSGAVKG